MQWRICRESGRAEGVLRGFVKQVIGDSFEVTDSTCGPAQPHQGRTVPWRQCSPLDRRCQSAANRVNRVRRSLWAGGREDRNSSLGERLGDRKPKFEKRRWKIAGFRRLRVRHVRASRGSKFGRAWIVWRPCGGAG